MALPLLGEQNRRCWSSTSMGAEPVMPLTFLHLVGQLVHSTVSRDFSMQGIPNLQLMAAAGGFSSRCPQHVRAVGAPLPAQPASPPTPCLPPPQRLGAPPCPSLLTHHRAFAHAVPARGLGHTQPCPGRDLCANLRVPSATLSTWDVLRALSNYVSEGLTEPELLLILNCTVSLDSSDSV